MKKSVIQEVLFLIINLFFTFNIFAYVSDLHDMNEFSSGDSIKSNTKYPFIAIFKDTLLAPIVDSSEVNEKEIAINMVENEIMKIASKDSVISFNLAMDSIWTFDTTISGRRCYGTIFSGPGISNFIGKYISKNIILLLGPSPMHISRLLNGLFIYYSDEAGWELEMKIKD